MTGATNSLPRSLGGYELVQRVGAGGMGTVYRAIDKRSGATVAIKVIHDHLQTDKAFVDRFRGEAHFASLLASPYIVRVIEFGFDQGQYFLVAEYVEGAKLSELIESKRLTADESLAIASQVAMALQAAAAHRVVHRDVKPDNIMIMADNSVKLMDFGVARLSYIETRQLFLGTVAYAAPEQFRGQTTIQSDIYSLGVVLFQMLAGELPFKGDTLSSLIRMHEETTPPLEKLKNVPDELRDVVVKCLEKAPAKRYADPSELLEALRHVRTTLTTSDDATWMANTMTGLAAAATVILPTSMPPAQASPPAPALPPPPPIQPAPAHASSRPPAPPLSRQWTTAWRKVPPNVLVGGGSAAVAAIVVALFFAISSSGDSPADSKKSVALAPKTTVVVAPDVAPAQPAPVVAAPAPEPTAVPPAPAPAPAPPAPAPVVVAPPPPPTAVPPPPPTPTAAPANYALSPNRNFPPVFQGVTATLTSLEVTGNLMRLTVRYTNASGQSLGLRCPSGNNPADPTQYITANGRTIAPQDFYCRTHPNESWDLVSGDSWSSSSTFASIAPLKVFDLTWYNWGTLSSVTLP